MTRLLFVLSALSAPAASADERAPFYGVWGTPEQCAGAPLQPGGTVVAEPFEIDASWLRHGRIWCRLSWFPVETRDGALVTGARAQCGEDAVRDYLLGMTIADGAMTLRWDFPLHGPLTRCPVS